MDYLTSEWPGTPNFKVDANFDMFPQIMGKNLQNELWARLVPSKLSERRPPTLFLGADTENGKKGFFSHFGQLHQCNGVWNFRNVSKNKRRQKNTCAYNIAFQDKSLNQHGGPNRYGSTLIQRFDLKRNIVGTYLFWRRNLTFFFYLTQLWVKVFDQP